MLRIKDLSVYIDRKPILHGLSMLVPSGKLHVLMGPNGSGKSSLAQALMGNPEYESSGSAYLDEQDLLSLPVHKRAQDGLYLAFQYPQELPGVSLFTFLKEAYGILHEKLKPEKFQKLLYSVMDELKIDHSFAYRNVHEGFSGGEKKRIELLQLLLLKPKVAILDELDSGLDADALKILVHGLNLAQKTNSSLSILLITHYRKILDFLEPDAVHIMGKGKIVESGTKELAESIERDGYELFV